MEHRAQNLKAKGSSKFINSISPDLATAKKEAKETLNAVDGSNSPKFYAINLSSGDADERGSKTQINADENKNGDNTSSLISENPRPQDQRKSADMNDVSLEVVSVNNREDLRKILDEELIQKLDIKIPSKISSNLSSLKSSASKKLLSGKEFVSPYFKKASKNISSWFAKNFSPRESASSPSASLSASIRGFNPRKSAFLSSADFSKKAFALTFAILMVFGAYFGRNATYSFAQASVKKIASAVSEVGVFGKSIASSVAEGTFQNKIISSIFGAKNSLNQFEKTPYNFAKENSLSFAGAVLNSAENIFSRLSYFAKVSAYNLNDVSGIAAENISKDFSKKVSGVAVGAKRNLASINSAKENTAGFFENTALSVYNKTNGMIWSAGQYIANIFRPNTIVVANNSTKTINNTIVQNGSSRSSLSVNGPQTVIQKTTERVVVGDISRAEVEAKLEQLNNNLSSKIYSLVSSANGTATYINNVYNAVAQTNRINKLDSVAISNSTITGATISDSTANLTSLVVSGSATSTFANGVQISSGCYLLPDGTCAGAGSGSGVVGASTAVGQVPFYASVGSTISATSSIFISPASFVGIGTTSPSSELSVYGDLILEGASRYLNFGTTAGASGYGLRDNAGTVEFKNSTGDWVGIGSGSGSGTDVNLVYSTTKNFYRFSTTTGDFLVGATATTSTAKLEVIGNGYFSGSIGIGTTTPFAKLSVSGNDTSTTLIGADALTGFVGNLEVRLWNLHVFHKGS